MQHPVIKRLRRFRALLWCLVLSLVFHFVAVPLIVGLFGTRQTFAQPRELIYQTSSALRVSRMPRPRPRTVTPPHPIVTAKQPPIPVHRAAAPPQVRRELAKIGPGPRADVPHLSPPSIDIAQQEAQYEKTIAQLRQENNPLAGAARPVETPAAPKRYTFDFSGSVGTGPQAEGILTPVESWRDGPYTYYYVRYYVQYADGSTETGYVPWPIRYLPKVDPFLNHWQHFPLPIPLPDYVMPGGTDLHPLIAFCWEHRSELSDCPIEHD